jgi:hypothetical protein
MPLNNGCWLDQHHGVQGLRPNPIQPHPEQPVCRGKLKPNFALPPQDGDLVPKGDKLKLQ